GAGWSSRAATAAASRSRNTSDLPDFPALFPGEDRDRVVHRLVLDLPEAVREQQLEFSRFQPEGRTALAVLEEEEPRDPPPRSEQLRDALGVARPQRPRQRAQERPLVDQVVRRTQVAFEEVGEPHAIRK